MLPIDEDGFTGEIPRTGFDVKEITGTYTQVTDVVKTFGPFPTNDVTQLEGLVDLEYSSPEWTVSETNSVGMPTAYMCTVTTKEASVSAVHTGYHVTATYEGTLTKSEQRMVITATYEGPDPDAIAPEPEPDQEDGQEASEGLPAGTIAAIAGGTAAAAAAVAGGIWFFPFIFGRRIRFRLFEVTAGEEKAVCDIKCRRVDGVIDVEVPEDYDVTERLYRGYFLPNRIARSKTQVRISQKRRGAEIELMPLSRIRPRYSFGPDRF